MVHLILLLQLIFFPYPEFFIYSYFTNNGLLPYKQIFDQHFPGLMFLPINFISLGVYTIQKMRFIHLGVIVITDIIFLSVSRRIFKTNKVLIFTSLILYIFWQTYLEGHVLWIESFITPLLLFSFLMTIKFEEKRNSVDLFISSFVLGISILFKQTVIPLIFIIFLFLISKKIGFKTISIALSILLLPIILVILHFYKLGIFNDFFYWTITFNLTTFAKMGKTYPTIFDLLKLLPIFGVSFFSILYLTIKHKAKYIILISTFLVGTLFFAYARFDFIHLQPALPYSILVFVLFLHNFKNRLFIPMIIMYMAVSFYIFLPNFRFYNKPGSSPMFNDPETLDLINKVNKYRNNSNTIFASGTYPHIYYLTRTMPPGKIASFQFPWFMKIAEKRVLQGIIDDPPQLIISDKTSSVGGYVLSEYMKDINNYIDSNYKIIDRVNNIEIFVIK
jgi:hypothetical protein